MGGRLGEIFEGHFHLQAARISLPGQLPVGELVPGLGFFIPDLIGNFEVTFRVVFLVIDGQTMLLAVVNNGSGHHVGLHLIGELRQGVHHDDAVHMPFQLGLGAIGPGRLGHIPALEVIGAGLGGAFAVDVLDTIHKDVREGELRRLGHLVQVGTVQFDGVVGILPHGRAEGHRAGAHQGVVRDLGLALFMDVELGVEDRLGGSGHSHVDHIRVIASGDLNISAAVPDATGQSEGVAFLFGIIVQSLVDDLAVLFSQGERHGRFVILIHHDLKLGGTHLAAPGKVEIQGDGLIQNRLGVIGIIIVLVVDRDAGQLSGHGGHVRHLAGLVVADHQIRLDVGEGEFILVAADQALVSDGNFGAVRQLGG